MNEAQLNRLVRIQEATIIELQETITLLHKVANIEKARADFLEACIKNLEHTIELNNKSFDLEYSRIWFKKVSWRALAIISTVGVFYLTFFKGVVS